MLEKYQNKFNENLLGNLVLKYPRDIGFVWTASCDLIEVLTKLTLSQLFVDSSIKYTINQHLSAVILSLFPENLHVIGTDRRQAYLHTCFVWLYVRKEKTKNESAPRENQPLRSDCKGAHAYQSYSLTQLASFLDFRFKSISL